MSFGLKNQTLLQAKYEGSSEWAWLMGFFRDAYGRKTFPYMENMTFYWSLFYSSSVQGEAVCHVSVNSASLVSLFFAKLKITSSPVEKPTHIYISIL